MKNFIPIFILLFSTSLLSAQDDYFARIMDWKDLGLSDQPTALFSIEDELIWSTGFETAPAFSSAGLMRTNLTGDIIWQIELDSTASGRMIMTGEEDFIFAGRNYSSIYPEGKTRLYKINKAGEILQEKYHLTSYPTQGLVGIKNTQEGFILIMLVKDDDNGITETRGILARYDNNLNLIWEKEYVGIPTNDMIILDVTEEEDGTFIVSGREGGWMHIQFIMKLDSEGNELWKSYDNDIVRFNGGQHYALADNYYVTGTESDGWQYPDSLLFYDWAWPVRITEFNSEGNLVQRKFLWRHGERGNSANQLLLDDNTVIICGYGRDNRYETAVEQSGCGWLVKLDADFDVVWERVICDLRTPSRDVFTTGLELSSGNLIYTGTTSNDLGLDNDTWLVHLDANGCLEPDCGYFQVIDEDGNYSTITATEDIIRNPDNPYTIVVYPSPAIDEINVELLGEQPKLNRLELVNVEGKVLKEYLPPFTNQSTITLSLPEVARGMYFLKGYTEVGIWSKKVLVQK